MSRAKNNRDRTPSRKVQGSVFQEAWENMNDDMARFMPEFIAKRIHCGKSSVWLMVLISIVELALLGVVGKLIYDWVVG